MKKHSTAGGFAILSVAVLLVKVLSVLYLPVLLAIIGGDGYGVYIYSYAIFTLIYSITSYGVPQAISKLVSGMSATGNYRDAVKAFKMARFMLVTVGFLFSVALFFSAKPLTDLLKLNRTYLAVLALSPTVILSTITASYRGYFQGRENMIPTAVSQVLEQIVNVVFTLLLAYVFKRYGVEAACAGGTLATSFAALFAAIYLIRTYKKNNESKIVKLHDPSVERFTNKEIFSKIINFSIPLIAYQGMFYIGNVIDASNTKVRLVHAGFTEVQAYTMMGELSRFNQLVGVPFAIIASLAVTLLPSISASIAVNDVGTVEKKINTAFKTCYLIAVPSAFGLSVLAYPIFKLIVFQGGAYIMIYGAYILILMSTVQVLSAVLQGLGKLYIVTFFLCFGVAGKIITNYVLIGIPSINILGAIVGSLVYFIVPLVLDNIILRRLLKLRVSMFKFMPKPVIASLAMSIVLFLSYHGLYKLLSPLGRNYATNAIATILAILLGSYAYFYIMALIKGIRTSDMNVLPSKMKKLIPGNIKRIIKD